MTCVLLQWSEKNTVYIYEEKEAGHYFIEKAFYLKISLNI